MILLTKHGEDLTPQLACIGCRRPMKLSEAWAVFPPLARGEASVVGAWGHRGCLEGHIRALFDVERVVLWRGRALLEKLLRE